MVKGNVALALLLFPLVAWAQTTTTPSTEERAADQLVEVLRQEALLVEISAIIRSEDDVTLWMTEVREITVFGKQVQVRISGQNITVAADFTPYTPNEAAEQIMLLAQGQTWVRSQDTDDVKYQSALRTMPISLGEPVLFYPLGVDLTDSGLGRAVLELQVTIHSLADVLRAAGTDAGADASGQPAGSQESNQTSEIPRRP